jgi:hypothetical protein
VPGQCAIIIRREGEISHEARISGACRNFGLIY